MSVNEATVVSSTSNWIIGSGTYGIVWNVLDPRNGKRVAVKRITNVFHSQRTMIMALRELKILYTFKHENVLAAIEVMKPRNVNRFNELHFVTELMDTDLQRLIQFEKSLSSEKIKVLLYQLMRGLKYIHSAKVIHRDIKPGNLLVSYDCGLKVCDFGFARAEAIDKSESMSLKVGTRSYRAPEILLGTKQYTGAIDIWAAACVFAEMLGRQVLFRPRDDAKQVLQMVDLLGTPSLGDIHYAPSPMKDLFATLPPKPSNISSLHELSPNADVDAVDLLSQMLRFDPTKRISADDALDHPYLDRAGIWYHSGMCKCCKTTVAMDLEPEAEKIYDNRWEKDITCETDARKMIYRFIKKRLSPDREPLCINPESEIFEKVDGDDSSTAISDGYDSSTSSSDGDYSYTSSPDGDYSSTSSSDEDFHS